MCLPPSVVTGLLELGDELCCPRRFQVMVGPNLGGQAAGRNLARFSAALGEDEPLRGPVRELADVAVLGGAAQEWFFLRYSDPEPTCACGSAASPRT